MENFEKLTERAKEIGFSATAPLDVSTLVFMPEVRAMCADGKCQRYNTTWSCPPACGTLEEMRDKVQAYSKGILVQTVGKIEDDFDWDKYQEIAELHDKNFHAFWKELKLLYPRVLAMGTGGCTRCDPCTWVVGEPCRFPDDMTASMEACGLLVSQVCTDNDLSYYYGPNTIAYTACFLLE
jgi:predicted metal-binding protein